MGEEANAQSKADKRARSAARAKAPDAKGKARLRFSGGLLDGFPRPVLLAVAALIVAAEISLTFCQLGFLGIGRPGDYVAYAMVLLAPVATGALLLGAPAATGFGLAAGTVLFAHAKLQPLDFYERLFVTPLSSFFLFTAAGLVLGLLFSLSLRRAKAPVARIAVIAVVCALCSVAVSFAFRLNVIYQVDTNGLGSTYDASTFINGVGNMWVQSAIDAAAMFVVCAVADIAVRLVRSMRDVSLRTTFRAWLFAVVLLAFMVAAAVSFVVVTEQEKAAAHDAIGDEASYIVNQLQERADNRFALERLESSGALPNGDEVSSALDGIVSYDGLLDGYSIPVDGYVYVIEDGTIVLSDDPGMPAGTPDTVCFTPELIEWFEHSSQTGEMLQVVYDSSTPEQLESGDVDRPIALQIVYMRALSTGDSTVVVALPDSLVFEARGGIMLWTTIVAVVLLAVVFAVASRLLVRIVARNVDATNRALSLITAGDLAVRVPAGDSREFASLSHGVNATVDALESWISEAESRIDAELSAAKRIQESALPRIFPPFPDILRFDIYAIMKPAKIIGGDFYDFFLIDGASADAAPAQGAASDDGCPHAPAAHRLGFLIADVSGKSVPAALFMMAAKSQIRSFMEAGMELGEAFENANRRLCEGNDAGMFVTAFAGVLDSSTGRITCVNAGHNPPLLWREGAWERIEQKSGLPLGLFDGLAYRAFELECGIGDELLLYTDGVTEAMNAKGELYTLERLEEVAAENFTLHPRRLIEAVRDDVAAFSDGAEQADDITMLALEVGVPPEITSTIVVPADDAELPRVREFVHSELDARLCPDRAQAQLDIAFEELFVNAAHYAYPNAAPDNPGRIRVSCTYSAEPPSITVEIADDGVPFDPLAKPDVALPTCIEEMSIGGLGILMAKKSVDAISYERVDGSNVVTIVKRW